METNYYKVALGRAMTKIATQRDRFTGPPTPTSTVTNPVVVNGGWECSAADEWATEVGERLSGLYDAFDDAHSVVQTAHDAQPDEVEDGHEHGNAYRSYAYPSGGGRNIPVAV